MNLPVEVFDGVEQRCSRHRWLRLLLGHEARDGDRVDRIGFGAAQLALGKVFGLHRIDYARQKGWRLAAEKVIEILPVVAGGFHTDAKFARLILTREVLELGQQLLIAGRRFRNLEHTAEQVFGFGDDGDGVFEFADVDTDEQLRISHDDLLDDDERTLPVAMTT